MGHPLSQRIAARAGSLEPDSPAIEFEGQWLSWRRSMTWLAGSAPSRIPERRSESCCATDPAHVAAFLGVLTAGGCVVVINPSRGDDRTRADISALRLPMIIGEPDDVTTLVAPSQGTTVVSMPGLRDEPRVSSGDRRGTEPNRPGVAVRMLTSGTTGPPKRIDLTYDMLARSVMGPEPDQAPPPERSASRRRDRQRAARPHRRGVPGAAMRHRGKILRSAGTLRPRSMGRRGAQTPAPSRVAGACRAADGAAFRTDPDGSGKHPRRHLRHRTPVGRRRRLVHREIRHPGPDILCCNGIRGRRGRLDIGRSPEVLAHKTGQRGRVPPSERGCGWSTTTAPRFQPTSPACWRSSRVNSGVDGVDPHRGHGPHRRGRIPVDSGTRRPGHHPRRLQGDAGRRLHRAGESPRGAGRGGDRTARRSPRGDSGGDGGAAPTEQPPMPASWPSSWPSGWRATRFPPRSRSWMRSRGPPPARPIWVPSGCSSPKPFSRHRRACPLARHGRWGSARARTFSG